MTTSRERNVKECTSEPYWPCKSAAGMPCHCLPANLQVRQTCSVLSPAQHARLPIGAMTASCMPGKLSKSFSAALSAARITAAAAASGVEAFLQKLSSVEITMAHTSDAMLSDRAAYSATACRAETCQEQGSLKAHEDVCAQCECQGLPFTCIAFLDFYLYL